ncbi:hypothetical protein [Mycobacteroides abscessus]|uniref:hypothetical protein n=1 Tax=Mycobacteroides abscessus TaxID=36809 RepID=UPI0019D186A4|nr:hypothetical protein [Mycobacteroides abscessus]MBN7411168.1 hypothetical protein [Mycobacteroides abscessus subsp. abscessus]
MTNNTDIALWGRVHANMHPDGRLALTLASVPCPQRTEDLDELHLLGRVRLPGDGEHKISVVAFHRDNGEMCRFYVIKPTHPADFKPPNTAGCDPATVAWLRDIHRRLDAEIYARKMPVWNLVRQLPEITEVFIGGVEDLDN